MANETTLNITGNLVEDVELRFTPSGAAVANFRIASTPRTFDRQSNTWKDGETLFMRCAAWKDLGENVAESLTKGMRVNVEGRLKSRSWDDKDGTKRTVMELEVDEIGPSLRYATAKVQRTQRNNNSGGLGNQQSQPSGFGPSTAQQDPWANQAGGFGNGNPEEVPF